VPAARATPQASVRAAARQIVADWLTPFFKTYPEYQRGSIDSLVRYLNHWDGVPRPPDHTRLRRLFDKAVTPTSVENLRANSEDIVGHLIDAMQVKARRDGRLHRRLRLSAARPAGAQRYRPRGDYDGLTTSS